MVSGCTRAEVTPAYGFRSVGGYGIRGWRVHCPSCGYLSHVYRDNFAVSNARHEHRHPTPEKVA